MNLFSKGRLLFWVRFPGSSSSLAALADLCEAEKLTVKVGQTVELSNEGIQHAFALQTSRRAVGKIVIDMNNAIPQKLK